jgi:hypothetical protein
MGAAQFEPPRATDRTPGCHSRPATPRLAASGRTKATRRAPDVPTLTQVGRQEVLARNDGPRPYPLVRPTGRSITEGLDDPAPGAGYRGRADGLAEVFKGAARRSGVSDESRWMRAAIDGDSKSVVASGPRPPRA